MESYIHSLDEKVFRTAAIKLNLQLPATALWCAFLKFLTCNIAEWVESLAK